MNSNETKAGVSPVISTAGLCVAVDEAIEAERARMVAFLMRLHDEHKARHNYFSYAVQCLQAEWGKSNLDKAFDRMMRGFDYEAPCVDCSTVGRADCSKHGWKTHNAG